MSTILDSLMNFKKPEKPSETGMCKICGKTTSNWVTEWPKGKASYFNCKECVEKANNQNDIYKQLRTNPSS